MTDDDYGEDRDPLLVRPFVLHDEGSAGDRSDQTWPSATTREVRSHRALEGADDPTAIFELPDDPSVPAPPPRHARPSRRRLVVLASAGAVLVLGATATGFAAFRSEVRPLTSAAQPADPLPAVTGPPTSSAPAPAGSASSSAAAENTTSASATSAAPSVSASAGSSAPSGTPSPPAGASAPAANGEPTAAPAPPRFDLAPANAERAGTIRGQNGLCLDLNGGVAVDDNHVQAYECNGSPAQAWTFAADGTLRVVGKCALVVGDGTVHVVGCDGRTTARWQISGQRLINAANGGCLTDPSAGRTSGTGVTVTTCNGSAGQRWSLP